MDYIAGYKNLNVWKKADELVLSVYKLTKIFPKNECFGLVSQMRRCAISIPANIVEGYGRRTNKDKSQFLFIARGSLNELEYYLDLSFKLEYIDSVNYQKNLSLRNDVGKLLNGFINSLNN
ncbi:MAG: four helix bundle protein [Candidatus Brennerbacteria bacterium]|nr:four helix bundle protein [Candidatus Brennerbacteria bacterium]